MSPQSVFAAANLLALVAWTGLLVRPRHPWVLLSAGRIVPVIFAVTYAVVVAMRLGRVPGDFNSLAGVAALFADRWVLLAGWIHYLAFDLLVGVWETRDAAERSLPHGLLVPCLVLTFLFGPLGWLLYLAIRPRFSRRCNTA